MRKHREAELVRRMSRANPFIPADESSLTLRKRWLGHPRYWICQVLGWGAFAASQVFTMVSIRPEYGLMVSVTENALTMMLGIAISHLLRIIYLFVRSYQSSDLLFEIFGDKGLHSRAAVGVAALPLGASVEVLAIIELA